MKVTVEIEGGKTQSAEFFDGVFKITQTKGKKPIAELRLVGKLENCSKKFKRASTSARRRRGGGCGARARPGPHARQAVVGAGAGHHVAGGGSLRRLDTHAGDAGQLPCATSRGART